MTSYAHGMLSGPCDPCLYPNWGSTAPAGTSVSKKETRDLKLSIFLYRVKKFSSRKKDTFCSAKNRDLGSIADF
jgi:hypothetical protein